MTLSESPRLWLEGLCGFRLCLLCELSRPLWAGFSEPISDLNGGAFLDYISVEAGPMSVLFTVISSKVPGTWEAIHRPLCNEYTDDLKELLAVIHESLPPGVAEIEF